MSALTLTDMIDEMVEHARIEALPAWDGIPLTRFIASYTPAADLHAAEERRRLENIRSGNGWKRDYCSTPLILEHHSLHMFQVDLRCNTQHSKWPEPRIECECMGDYLSQAVCDHCEWHVIGAEKDVVAQWHDHAMPGWRELPTLPDKLRGSMGTTKMTARLQNWFEENYPAHFRVPGAPILTTREQFATRSVPAYSPYGGYDIAAEEQPH